jgi:hypothetical protein
VLISSVAEIRKVQQEIPEGLLPFMKEEQDRWWDIYAFELADTSPEYSVVVWADHAIVERWKSFPAYTAWLRQWILEHRDIQDKR